MKAALLVAALVLLEGGTPSYTLYPYVEQNNSSVHNHILEQKFNTTTVPQGTEKSNIGEKIPYNPKPCMKNPNNNAYENFVNKHVLQTVFDTSSPSAWKDYLQKYNLCDRPRQSFVDKGAENLFVNICNGFGKLLWNNLCTSTQTVWLHDLNVNTWDCSITYLESGNRYVTVACDIVDNRCLPVHFQSSQNNGPNNNAQECGAIN
ncbi:uncharacterized protein LOC122820760 isoform X2 [Gambusia affinis]|nr:uncharacterized protein LOC122820760 isoform X2 [Gambusia affinis]XP_043954282.1 uncharacterized protein LOC122820760 isoform X2 [Gambusia affinis]